MHHMLMDIHNQALNRDMNDVRFQDYYSSKLCLTSRYYINNTYLKQV